MVGFVRGHFFFFSIWSSNKDAATEKGCTLSQALVLKLRKITENSSSCIEKKIFIDAIICTTFHPQIGKDLTPVHFCLYILHMIKTHVLFIFCKIYGYIF